MNEKSVAPRRPTPPDGPPTFDLTDLTLVRASKTPEARALSGTDVARLLVFAETVSESGWRAPESDPYPNERDLKGIEALLGLMADCDFDIESEELHGVRALVRLVRANLLATAVSDKALVGRYDVSYRQGGPR